DRVLAEMDLVTRDEFARVEAMAQKARMRQEELEERLAALEGGKKQGKTTQRKTAKPATARKEKDEDMYNASVDATDHAENPMDLVEEIATGEGWSFTRQSHEAIFLRVKGKTETWYDIHLEWQEEFSALLFAFSIPVEIQDQNYEMTIQALEQINQNLWMGH